MKKYSLEAIDLLSKVELVDVKAGAGPIEEPVRCQILCATCTGCTSIII